MSIKIKIALTGVLVPALTAGAMAIATPASATDPVLSCDNTTSQVIVCDLALYDGGVATHERWTVNGSAYTAGKNSGFIVYHCGAGFYNFVVTYRDENGALQSQSDGISCRTGVSV